MNKKRICIGLIVSATILLLTFIAFIVNTTIDCIVLANCDYCSAPWYVEIYLNCFIYGIPLIVELIPFVYFLIKFIINKKVN